MSLAALLTETVQVITTTGTTTNDEGDVSVSASTTASVPARLEQTDTTEVSVGREMVTADWIVYLGPDVTITAADRVIDAADRVFEVIGAPEYHRTPSGVHHVSARLRYVEG